MSLAFIHSPDCDSPAGGIRDLAGLYRELSGRLERRVRAAVRPSDAVVEDACQFAWSRLVLHRSRVSEETVFGWLVQTAIHEALKMSRRRARELSLDDVLESGIDPIAPTPEPWELIAQRERMNRVCQLAIRPQRFVWLRALGLSSEEMAAHERCSPRTVERQLARARRELRRETVARREAAAI